MNEIQDILERGVANIIPSKEKLETLFNSGKTLNIYVGIDPTSTKIHLGHAFAIRKLQKLLNLGHNVTFLIGDFTALVGDTSDKESERPILTVEEIEENFKTYKSQAEKFLDFSKVKVVRNSEWLSKLTFKELIHITQQFSLNDFISRELIKKRLEQGAHIRLDETLYPLMQGYDSYILDTDIQLGGTDQTFNMQAGRTLLKALKNKESFIIANNFLTGTDGRKMSKSWGNGIWLEDSSEEVYGKVMSIKDELIVEYYTLGTNVPLSDIEKIAQELKQGTSPLQIKKNLALQITTELHDQSKAKEAGQAFENKYQKDEPETLSISRPFIGSATTVVKEMANLDSNAEAKRLITQGAVSIDEVVITDHQKELEIKPGSGTIIRIGKHYKKKII